MIKSRVAFLAAALLSAASIVSAAAEKNYDPLSFQSSPDRVSSQYVKAEFAKGAKDVKRVFLSAFRLQFVTSRETWVEVTDGSSKNLQVQMTGLDDSALQLIADEAGQIFLSSLVKRGFEVVKPEALAANSLYQQISTWASTAPVHLSFQDENDQTAGEAEIFSPFNMPLYFNSAEPGGSALNAAVKDSPDDLEPVLVHQLDAALLRVTLRVDFIQFSSLRKIFRDNPSNVPYEPVLRVTGRVDMMTPATISVEEKPFNRGLKISANENQPRFVLSKPVSSAGFFVTKSDVQAKMAADGGIKDVNMAVNPDVYKEGVLNNVRNAADLLAYRIKNNN